MYVCVCAYVCACSFCNNPLAFMYQKIKNKNCQ